MTTRKQTPKDAAFQFFYNQAGYSVAKGETKEQGRARTARQLAKAERDAKSLGYRFEWEEDWSIGSHREYYGADSAYAHREPDTCETCMCISPEGEVVASLGCIDDASANYRRVVEAELALEALAD